MRFLCVSEKPCAALTNKIHPKQVLNGHQTALTTLGVLGGPMSVMRKSKREALANITNSPQQCEFPSLKAPASQSVSAFMATNDQPSVYSLDMPPPVRQTADSQSVLGVWVRLGGAG